MKTIFADFNAMTEAGHVSLETRGSKEDVARAKLGPGDWAWLTDSEVFVGAQLAVDDRYGLVAVPDWDTLVHLDDDDAKDLDRVTGELHRLLTKKPHANEDEPRIFELLTQLEFVRPGAGEDWPQSPSFRRAVALRQMGKLRLALLEIDDARRSQPDDPLVLFLRIDLLRLENLPAAVLLVESVVDSPGVPALVLSACINVLAAQAEQADDNQFDSTGKRVLALCDQLEQAPNRDLVGRPLLALSHFNRGMILLRASRVSQAQREFERAYDLYPNGPMLEAARKLRMYDRHAREVARDVRAIAEEWRPPENKAA